MTTCRRKLSSGLMGCLLWATLSILAACGRNDAAKVVDAAGAKVPAEAYVQPLGPLSEADSQLFLAAGKGDVGGAEQAIKAGANINVTDKLKRTALFSAAFYNRAEMANFFLDHGAEVGANDRSGFAPVHAGVLAGGKEVVSALIARGANINERVAGGRTSLHLAAATNQPAMVDLLLQNGANSHVKDNEGFTPAALAARNGHAAVAGQIRRWAETQSTKK